MCFKGFLKKTKIGFETAYLLHVAIRMFVKFHPKIKLTNPLGSLSMYPRRLLKQLHPPTSKSKKMAYHWKAIKARKTLGKFKNDYARTCREPRKAATSHVLEQ